MPRDATPLMSDMRHDMPRLYATLPRCLMPMFSRHGERLMLPLFISAFSLIAIIIFFRYAAAAIFA